MNIKEVLTGSAAKFILGFVVFLSAVYFMLFHPFREYDSVIELSGVEANWPFAGNIKYKGEVIGASSELCVYLWLHEGLDTLKEIPVKVEERLFFTYRYPKKSESPSTN